MTFMLSVFTVLSATLFFTSCQPSRVWGNNERESHAKKYKYAEPSPAPGYYGHASLIISPSPGFAMKQYQDGRYYHQSQQGYMYWKGYDNRFYLDKTYLSRVRYNKWEYREWKRYSRGRG